MASTRMCKAALSFAASLALCGAPLYAQVGTSSPGSSQNPNGTSAGSTSGSGSMSGSSAGSMSGSSSAGSINDTMTANSGKVSAEDKHFMKEAMEGDMAEIKLAQLAQQKASSDQVKQFAQRMIDDHTKLDAQMKPMAQQFGVEAPTDLSAKHKAVETKLQGLSGAQFDQEYMKAMVSDHREDDQAFQREQTQAKDTELKNAVSQAEPIIAEHLRMAQDAEKSLKGNGSNSSM
jgi:putative membrane protein